VINTISRRRLAVVGLTAPLLGPLMVSRAMAQQPPAEPIPPAAAPAEANTNVATTTNALSHMIAPVTINGQGPFKFLVDTGANRSAINAPLAARLNLPPGPAVRLHTVAGVRERPSVTIDELKVGERIQRRVRAPTIPILNFDADGVLGVDWLKASRLTFDFKNNQIEIVDSRNAEAAMVGRQAVVVPARLRSGQITIIDADLGGRRINAMIDSGGETSLGNPALRALIIRSQEPGKPQEVELTTITGERLAGEMLYVPFIRLGGLLLGNVPIVFAKVHVFELWNMDRDPALILGMDLLRQFDAVTMDYGRARVRFDMLGQTAP
jgi:predicted aspartyl protease